ncbi:6719_t:CDS:1 [Cetraspora pellucida]|uniref:6719_t:CDS:1 n=1 Tax=Cetraspora pellucida TaxID=1433469 RepID=A0A9N9NHN3_9GLOM|nr:6719_t:CDS:1 [Cetraspora pellucida]
MEISSENLSKHTMNFNKETSIVQETVQNTDIEPESSQKQTTSLKKKMQKNNIVINIETLSSNEENIDNFTENMILEETIADLHSLQTKYQKNTENIFFILVIYKKKKHKESKFYKTSNKEN